MSDMMPLNDLAQEANDNHEQVISNAKKAISAAMAAGAALLRAKEQVAHGDWGAWQKQNLNYSQPTAFRYMTIASNYSSMNNLKDAKDINDALRMISERKAEENPEHVPRSERKTGRVTVETAPVMPTDEDPHAHHEAEGPDENAVPAEPKTNTKHSKATTKAREADRPVPAVVTPEIVDEPETLPERTTLSDFTLDEIFQFITDVSEGDVDNVVKRLRKLLDRLDPPKSGKTPRCAELVAMIPDDWAPELQKAAADWAEYKQARAKGERIQTVRAWELALEKFTSQPSKTVISKVNKAIENSWKGWDHDSAANGNSATTNSGRGTPIRTF